MPRIVAVIPAYNEALTIGSIVLQVRQVVDEVIVVDDGSADATSFVAKLSGATCITRTNNGGKGAALRDGFLAALDAKADVVVTLDGDGQHSAADVTSVIAPILADEADVVVGSRHGLTRRQIPRHRRFGQKILTIAARIAGSSSRDSESGFRAYRASALRQQGPHSNGYGADWEILLGAERAGARIVDVPIHVSYEVPRPSKEPAASHFMQVIGSVLRFARHEHPLLLFSGTGTLLLLVGLGLGAQTAAGYYQTGEFWAGKAMVSMLATIVGAVLLMSGLVLDSVAHLMLRKGAP